jgi:hypothetical protein
MAAREKTLLASTPTNNDFWKFWFGQICSNLGNAFTIFALPLLIFNLTGSALNLALVPLLFCQMCCSDWSSGHGSIRRIASA